MDRLLATEARTDRTVAEVELRQGCESRGGRCNWRRLHSPMRAAKVHLTQCARRGRVMSALAQKRTFSELCAVSVLHLKAEVDRAHWDVR